MAPAHKAAFFAICFVAVAAMVFLPLAAYAETQDPQDDAETGVDFNAESLGVVKAGRQEILNAEKKIKEIQNKGLPTARVLDLLTIAKLNFDFAVEKASLAKENPDLLQYREKMNEFRKISDMEYRINDELAALRIRIDESKKLPEIESVEELYNQARAEFKDERFERAAEIITQTDQKMVELASLQTRVEAIYEAASANIVAIVKNHQTEIFIGIILPLILGLIFRHQIKLLEIQAKIRGLDLEKKILNEEKKKAQANYFVNGNLSESSYKSKMQVYSDMERDITRELSVLKEEEQKLNIIGKHNKDA